MFRKKLRFFAKFNGRMCWETFLGGGSGNLGCRLLRIPLCNQKDPVLPDSMPEMLSN